MNPADKLPEILNEKGLKMIEGKHCEVDGVRCGGGNILIIYIAPSEKEMTIYREQMLKSHDEVCEWRSYESK